MLFIDQLKDFYTNNEMFTFFMSTVEGRVVLGTYANTNKVQYNILSRLIVLRQYDENTRQLK